MTASAPASTASVAQDLVALCRRGQNLDAINKFYDKDIVSIESMGSKEMPAEMRGIDAIRKKNEWWYSNNEIHGTSVEGPFLGENQFAVRYEYDTTFKPTGKRGKMKEMALYTVRDGKIVREEFFYNVPTP